MRLISIDFETTLISAEEPIPRPICLSYADNESGDKGLVVGMDNMESFLFNILACTKPIIAHNMRFEALVIDEHFPKLRPLLYDKIENNQLICTKVYEQLLDNVRKKQLHRFSLDKLVDHYFKVDISGEKTDPDAWRLRYSELEGIAIKDWPERAIKYAVDDSIWALKVYLEQLKTPMDIYLSVAADIYLNKMGTSGIYIDKERVNLLEKELLAKIIPGYKKLELVGLAAPKAGGKYSKKMNNLREYIKEHVEAVEHTAKGNVATSGESIERYISTLTDEGVISTLEDYLQVMKYEKVLTSFVVRLKKADPLVRSNYKAVVSSGRTSSSTAAQYASVNIQQMPRQVPNVTWDIRNCFVPKEGYKIVSIDYSGLELAATAHQLATLTGMTDMRDIINSGTKPVDMHSMFAYRVMNIKEKTKETYESFLANKKTAPYSEYRQLAKPINLGFPGGIGYDTMRSLLAKEGIYPKLVVLETSAFEANLVWKRSATRKEGYPTRIRRTGFREFQLVYDELYLLKQELFGLYPDLEAFLSEGHLKYLTGEYKMVKNEYGEWEREPMYSFTAGGFKRDWCMYTQVCNGLLMQSPSAIGAKKAMVKIISKYANSDLARPLAFIHDEIVFEVRNDKGMYDIIEDISEILIDEMQTILTGVRISVEAEAFDYWKKAGGFFEKTYWKDPGDKELKEMP